MSPLTMGRGDFDDYLGGLRPVKGLRINTSWFLLFVPQE